MKDYSKPEIEKIDFAAEPVTDDILDGDMDDVSANVGRG